MKVKLVTFLTLMYIVFSQQLCHALMLDFMIYDNTVNYNAALNRFFIFGTFPDEYKLSDGSVHDSGAGGMRHAFNSLDSFQIVGDDILYDLGNPFSFVGLPPDSLFQIAQSIDGQPSDQDRIRYLVNNSGPLILKAKYGTNKAYLNGFVTPYEDTSSFSSTVNEVEPTSGFGNIAPFSLEYGLLGNDVWNESVFDSDRRFSIDGYIDFTEQHSNVIPEPSTMLLFGTGLLGAFVRKRKKS